MARKKKAKGQFVSWLEAQRPALVLLVLAAVACAVRFILALLTSQGPKLFIDEGLYVNIAKGLFFEGEVSFRAQAVSYLYLIYPLILMPLYLLPPAIDMFRAVQLWNILIMTSAVIPVYLLARRMNLSRGLSYVAVIFLLIMPDMIVSTFLVSECLLYPLTLWLFYFAYRMGQGSRPYLMGIMAALFTVLLYFTKPGNIVFSGVILLLLIVTGVKGRDWTRVKAAALALGIALLLVVGGYALYNALFDRISSVLTLYQKQIPDFSLQSVLRALQSSALHLLLFIFSGIGIIVLLPALERKQFSDENRLFLDGILLSVIVSAVGTAVMVSLYEWVDGWLQIRVHLRYLMYYMPPLFLYTLSLPAESGKKRKAIPIVTGICMLLFIYPSAFRGFNINSTQFDSLSIAAFHPYLEKTSGIVLIVAVLAFLVCFLIRQYQRGWTQALGKAMVFAVTVFMLVNNIAGYEVRYDKLDPGIASDAKELVQTLGDEPFLVVTGNHYDDFRGYQLDVRLRRPTQFVVTNNLLLDELETGGVYRPFTPLVQAPNIANAETIDTDLLVTDITVADYLETTDAVETWQTTNGYYTVKRIDKGAPWLKTAIASMEGFTLPANKAGSLVVYDDLLLSRKSLTLHVNMCAPSGAATVTFSADGQRIPLEVTQELTWYALEIPVPGSGFEDITFFCDKDIVITEYWTE